jgi:hypothetical protein
MQVRETGIPHLIHDSMPEIISTRFTMQKPAAFPDAILDLLRRFEFRRDARLTGTGEMMEFWKEFIDPFFMALGWDMQDSTTPARVRGAYARRLRVTTRDRATYSSCLFGLDGHPQFLVVLGTPPVCTTDHDDTCPGLRRYAWNAEIPLLIITNCKEWAVYDCTHMPEPRDDEPDARIASFTFRDYPGRWDWMSSIFSKEAVIAGSVRDYAGKAAEKRGSAGVAAAFLRDLERWREILARDIANRNHAITTDELNDAVHQTICRVIFLRLCEDRGIHVTRTLLAHLEGAIPPWVIDDAVIEGITGRLSGPAGPYEVSAIPPATLAAVFGRFLEKTVRMRGGHHPVIETRPGERDPGIISPPRFIVEYMVRNMTGVITGSRTPREIAPLRILDPSCCGGLFLSGMYEALLDWHLGWYTMHLIPVLLASSPPHPRVDGLLPAGAFQDGEIAVPVYYPGDDANPGRRFDWRLTFREKTRILLNAIYGVDINRQAVRMTILLLMLHLIRDEVGTTPDLSRILESVLPTLHEHIRCGNSLIGPDYFDLGQTHPYHYREEKKVNPFTWHTAFSEVMEHGGFDALIGNPPSSIPAITREQKQYLQTHYSVYRVTPDLTPYFIEKGISLLAPGGKLSVLVSSEWLRAGDGKPLRKYLVNRQIEEIIDFDGRGNEIRGSCILRVSNTLPVHPFRAAKVKNLGFADLDTYVRSRGHPVDQTMLQDGGWTLEDTRTAMVIGKLRAAGRPLEEYVMCQLTRGTGSGYPASAIIDEQEKTRMLREDPRKGLLLKPFLRAKDIHRYAKPRPGRYVIVKPDRWPASHTDDTDTGKRLPVQALIPRQPSENRSAERTGSRSQGKPGEQRIHGYSLSTAHPCIITSSHAERPSFTLDTGGSLADDQITIIAYHDLYLLGILNSKVTDFFIRATTTGKPGPSSRYTPRSLSRIPVYTPDFDNPVDKSRHDRIELLVTRLLDLYDRLQHVTLSHEQCLVREEIGAIEGTIDEIVYTLYGLAQTERIFIDEETSRYPG